MRNEKIDTMQRPVTEILREREARARRARTPRPRPVTNERIPGGRAWINGREVGGADLRFPHLAGGYD